MTAPSEPHCNGLALHPSINSFPTVIGDDASAAGRFKRAKVFLDAAALEFEQLASRDRGDGARWRSRAHVLRELIRSVEGDEPTDLNGEFGVKIRAARDNAGMTQQELAKKAGVSLTWIRNLEAGRVRASRRTVLRLMQVPGLNLGPEALRSGAGAGTRTEPLNWWVAPHLDPVSMLQELQLRLGSSGCRIEQTYMYLDPQSALDWYTLSNEPDYAAGYRNLMPLEEASRVVLELCGRVPIDLVALGPGDGRQETRLAQAIVSKQVERDLRFLLLDISQPLLSKAYRYAKDCLDETRGVFVVGMFGNFHYLPLYEQIFYSPAKRRRVFTMLGSTFGNLDDEERFLSESLRCAGSGDLLVLDFSQAVAPAADEQLVRKADPVLNQPMPAAHLTWLSGPFRRYLSTRHVEGSVQLGRDSRVPGSYSLEAQIVVLTTSDERKEFVGWRQRRYDHQRLSEWAASLGWHTRYYAAFGSSARRNNALVVLQKV